jgi:transposase
LDLTETGPPRPPAGRRSDSSLAGRALARGQKKAVTEGRTLAWLDESGFYLLPAIQRTYAPIGQTPVLHHHLTNDHLSAISAITPDGRLYLQVQEQSFRSEDVVCFLEHLLRHIPGKLPVIWDGSPIHRSQVIKDFLASGAAERIHLERLPGYAPDLNPDEGIWNYLKRVELKNVCCRNLAQLRTELRKATKRLRHKKHIVKACIRQPGYA